MASTSNLDLSKKSLKPRCKPSIPVRQTKTSKIRSELGNKLEYLKSNLQKLKETAASNNSTLRSDITNSKESIKSENETFKKPHIMSRKSVVSRSSEVISRTNSGLKQSTYKNTINKSPTSNKNIPIKSTQSERKLKPKQINSNQKTNVTTYLHKTTQPSNSTKQINSNQKKNNIKTYLNKTTQPPNNTKQINTNQNNNVKICLNKTTQPTNNIKEKNIIKSAPVINKINNMPKNVVNPPLLKPTLKTREITIIKNEKKTVKIQSPLRKSISAMHLKRVSIRDPTTAIYRSFSAVNVSQTIDENETLQIPNFNTPMAKRRSVYNSTPMTGSKNSKNVSPWSGCWSPTAQDLKRRLSIWMEKTGKPYNSFNNLRCFGMHYLPAQEENKENVKVEMKDKDSSYEDLKIQLNEVEHHTAEDLSVAYEALHDLHKLILEGYPVDQCEAWLDVIRTRFEELEDKQQYWECMAAIDEARGNTEMCYTNDENESYLDNLLQKFNVLNLTPSSCHQRRQRRNTLNNSNIFKSTAINFAVKENSKNQEKEFLVTPIKRSTRQSTAGKLTPGIIICSTLDELESPVRNSMRFRTNKALKK